ncbi:MAG: glycosyl transferase [Candidatus Hydrogenedentota bacterium]
MSKPLTRVCYVIPTLDMGGTERQLICLMKGLIHDFEITVICTRYEGTLAGEARRMGAYVRQAESWGGWDFTLERKIRNMFRQHRPDIVHTFMFGFDLPVNKAARATGVPVVISSRRQRATWKKARHIRIQKKANLLADAIVANSNAVREFACEQEGLDPAAVRVIYNGIDADAFVSSAMPTMVRERFDLPHEPIIVGMVANFSPAKDHELFVQAAEHLLSQRDNLHFLMAGAGPYRKEVLTRIRNSKWSSRFSRVSTIQEIADLYRIMSVCVLTSKTEGFPNTVLEAMAANRPVVAAAVGGIPEQIEDGITGRLIRDRRPESFAEAIAHLIEHPQEAEAMGQRAGESVRARFSVESMVNSYRNLYRELLVESARRSA